MFCAGLQESTPRSTPSISDIDMPALFLGSVLVFMIRPERSLLACRFVPSEKTALSMKKECMQHTFPSTPIATHFIAFRVCVRLASAVFRELDVGSITNAPTVSRRIRTPNFLRSHKQVPACRRMEEVGLETGGHVEGLRAPLAPTSPHNPKVEGLCEENRIHAL